MSQQANNNEKKKITEKCLCTKKIVALDKAVKELKVEIERQAKLIETIKKALKR